MRRIATLAVVALLAGGCSSNPHIASGTLADSKQRILKLVNATGAALGSPAEFTPVHTADALPCYQKRLGYTVKHLAANQAEVPVQIKIRGTVDGASLLARVATYWKSRGYTIDRSGMNDHPFPKLRAHAGPDLLVATGYAQLPEINLYGVTPCVRS